MPVIPIYGEDMTTSGSTRSVRDEGKNNNNDDFLPSILFYLLFNIETKKNLFKLFIVGLIFCDDGLWLAIQIHAARW